MTTADYLNSLQQDKANLVANLNKKGVEATNNETFTSLVPKVLDIPSGAGFTINDMTYLFYQGARLDIYDELVALCKNVESVHSTFREFPHSTLDVNGIDVTNVTNMNSTFRTSKLEILDLRSWNTPNATIFYCLAEASSNLVIANISGLDTSKATNMANMFNNCSNLETVIIDNPNVLRMIITSVFNNTPIADGTGYIYVPDNLVDSYKVATNWTTYADQIKPLSELPEEVRVMFYD